MCYEILFILGDFTSFTVVLMMMFSRCMVRLLVPRYGVHARGSCAYAVLYLFLVSLDIVALVFLWPNAEVIMILTDCTGRSRVKHCNYKTLGLPSFHLKFLFSFDKMETFTAVEHNSAVQKLASEVAQFHAAQIPFRINHGWTNSTRTRDPSTPQLNIAHLNHVLSIDTATRTATVEPNVPLDFLVSECLKKGLMPLVVMEFPGITVGGGFSGASGESTGWREGLFDCSIDEVEMILGNGEITLAKQCGTNSDLFNGARCTLGTLGVITLLKVRLTQAKDAVNLVYHHTTSVKETISRLADLCGNDTSEIDFIEAIQYSMEQGVIITGRRISSADAVSSRTPFQRFDRAIDPWFYMHAKETSESYAEIVPTQSYLFRHDRGAFWSGELFIKYLGLPNNRLVRCLVNPVTKARAIYKGMLSTNSADGAIIQDLLLPVDTSEAFVEYVNEELSIWPLWICPIRKKANGKDNVGWPFYKTKTQSATAKNQNDVKATILEEKDEIVFNFGVWGPTDAAPAVFRKTNRRLEEKLRELRGMKVPYAANFYTEDEFWTLYDRPKYEELREKWHAEALPNMYDKVCRKQSPDVEEEKAPESPQPITWKDKILQVWPLGGMYQAVHAILT
jgi:delta24-sterol reductase